jgi:hypothetical protein
MRFSCLECTDVGSAIWPDLRAFALFLAFFEVSGVFYPVRSQKDSSALLFISHKRADVFHTVVPVIHTFSIFLIVFKVAEILGAKSVSKRSLALLPARDKLTFVCVTILEGVFSFAVALAIFKLSNVLGAMVPGEGAHTIGLIVGELSSIGIPVSKSLLNGVHSSVDFLLGMGACAAAGFRTHLIGGF